MSNTDRIEKRILLKAPVARVWRALTDAEEFGRWFGVALEGPFVAGATTRGRITIKGYESLAFEVAVERIDPPRSFAYRWHPYAIDPAVDYRDEPTTRVEFTLAEGPEGTELTVVESGFDALPAHRRDEAFRMNERGWAAQVGSIERHVTAV